MNALDQELYSAAHNAWNNITKGSYFLNNEYPLPITMRGKTLYFSAWKKSSAGPLYLKLLKSPRNGEKYFEIFRLDSIKGLVSLGFRILGAYSEEARKLQLADFAKVFEEINQNNADKPLDECNI